MTHNGPALPAKGLLHERISEVILVAFYAVYNELGPGFPESVYVRAMMVELELRGLDVLREVAIPVTYRGRPVGEYRADLPVASRIIVECKACSRRAPAHEAQLLHYLKATGIEVGLILNFGPRPSNKRMIRTFGSKHPISLPVLPQPA